jgi:hypothetical protein
MAYIANPDTATQPTDAVNAETATQEFQQLKTKINGMIGLWNSGSPSLTLSGLQTSTNTSISTLTALTNTTQANLSAYITSNNAAISILAPIASPAFTGGPTIVGNPATNDNSQKIPTTSWVVSLLSNAITGYVSLAGNNTITGNNTFSGSANFTGSIVGFSATTTGVTQPAGTANSTLATTAFVATTAITATPSSTIINQTAAFTASAFINYGCDTNGGPFTATLPASPFTGMAIRFIDVSQTWDTKYLTINGNGNNIGNSVVGYSTPLICNLKGADLLLRYNGTNWSIV